MRGLFVPGFEVWRADRAPDDAGGWTRTFALSSSVDGRLSPISAAETPRGMQERGVLGLRFSCPAAVDIKAGDQVRTGSRIATVDAVRTTSTGLRKECICEEVNAD
jgi:hypothetical protein